MGGMLGVQMFCRAGWWPCPPHTAHSPCPQPLLWVTLMLRVQRVPFDLTEWISRRDSLFFW